MRNMTIRKLLLPLVAMGFAASILQAQTVKTITVSNEASYTDHISLGEDSRDMDVMVKFIFDEQKNVLTVSALSYRHLFVFRDAARYPTVVRHNCLIPDKMPYVVEADPGSKFKLSKPLLKAIPKPKKKYIFKRWLECDGLQPVPMEYKMANDYIEQTFDILQKRSVISVTLRDLYILDQPGKPGIYEVARGRDLNTRYQIRILRNPCLGMEEDIATAAGALAEVKAAFENFRKNYAGGSVASDEAMKTFNDTKVLLLTQFPAKTNTSPCPDLQAANDKYNHYVDSISALSCKVNVIGAEGLIEDESKPLDVKLVYTQARQLDKAVSKWLTSKDDLEKEDLVSQCRDIIKDMSSMIQHHPATTAEEQKAVKTYYQAEQYFKKTCGK